MPYHNEIETKVVEKRRKFLFSSKFVRDSSERISTLDREPGTNLKGSDAAVTPAAWSRVCALDDRVVVLAVPAR